jgi:hypothetical protein
MACAASQHRCTDRLVVQLLGTDACDGAWAQVPVYGLCPMVCYRQWYLTLFSSAQPSREGCVRSLMVWQVYLVSAPPATAV